MSQEQFFTIFVVPPFALVCILALIQAILTRSILRILREIAPEKEAELAVHTGVLFIDTMFWVRPTKFAAFTRSNTALGDARLAQKLSQYKRTHQLYLGVMVYFGVLMVVLFVLFARQ